MEIWQDGVLAGLAAVGLTALLWLLAGSLFRWRERPLDAVYLVLVDGGLTAEGRQRVELLTARYGAVLVTPQQLAELYTKER